MHRRFDDDSFHRDPPDRSRYDSDWRQNQARTATNPDWPGYEDERRGQRSSNEPYGMWNEHRAWPQRGSDYGRNRSGNYAGRDDYAGYGGSQGMPDSGWPSRPGLNYERGEQRAGFGRKHAEPGGLAGLRWVWRLR